MLEMNEHEIRFLSRSVRKLRKQRDNLPVVIVEGDFAPSVCGSHYYWTTPSGKTRIHYPNAYKWPKLYNHSTRRIEVGDVWAARFLKAHKEEVALCTMEGAGRSASVRALRNRLRASIVLRDEYEARCKDLLEEVSSFIGVKELSNE